MIEKSGSAEIHLRPSHAINADGRWIEFEPTLLALSHSA